MEAKKKEKGKRKLSERSGNEEVMDRECEMHWFWIRFRNTSAISRGFIEAP